MATEKKATKKIIPPAGNMLKTVSEQLTIALAALKEKLGEKEFKKRVKKAAKKLVAGIKNTPLKYVDKKDKATSIKKKATKAAAKNSAEKK